MKRLLLCLAFLPILVYGVTRFTIALVLMGAQELWRKCLKHYSRSKN